MEGTPFRSDSRLPFAQGTPLSEPHTPLEQTTPVTPNVQPRQQVPHTPLKMFEQTPPSAQAEERASRGKQPSFRSSPAAVKLPAVPTRPLYSYGTVGQVSMPTMDIRNSVFGGAQSHRGLVALSARSHIHRQTGMDGPQSGTSPGTQGERRRNTPTQAKDIREDTPEPILDNPRNPRNPRNPSRTRPQRRRLPPRDNPSGSMSIVIAWNKVRSSDLFNYIIQGGRYYGTLLLKLAFIVAGIIATLGFIYYLIIGFTQLILPNDNIRVPGGSPRGTGRNDRSSTDQANGRGSWFRRTTDYFIAPTTNPTDAQEVISRLRAVEQGVERLDKERVDMVKIEREFESLSIQFEKDREDITDRFEALGKFTARLDLSIKRNSEDIKTLMRFKEQTNEAFKKLHQDLPEMMPVRRDSNGKLSIHPEFFLELKEYFRREFPGGVGGVKGGGEDRTIVVEKPAKWGDFIGRNKQPFDQYVSNLQQKWWEKTKREESLVSKMEFIELLKKEWNEHLGKLEGRFTEVHDKLHSQASSLTGLKEALTKGTFGKGKGGAGDSHLSTDFYHTYKLADYASHAGGAYIDPARTSPTYENHPSNGILRFFHDWAGSNGRIPKPRTVISSTRPEPGNCWPFSGKTGTVGIILREPVFVSGLTLEHVDWDHALVKNATPKSISLWLRVPEREKYFSRLVRAAADALSLSQADVQAPTSIPIMEEYVRVAKFEYHFDENSHSVQTWAVPVNLKSLDIATDRVVVAVTDNHGNEEYTCVYRLRVHGEPSKKPLAGSEPITPPKRTETPQSKASEQESIEALWEQAGAESNW